MLKSEIKELIEAAYKAGALEYGIKGEQYPASIAIDKLWNQSEMKKQLEPKPCKDCGSDIQQVTTLEYCEHCLFGEDA